MSTLQVKFREELSRANSLEPELIKLRRVFHANPELRFEQYDTARTLQELLQPCELSVTAPVAETGLLADLRGGLPGPTIALRADMDALPIQEATALPFASQRPGVMHACGHDAHMTIGYGVLKVLEPLRPYLPGTLRVIFQPGEEVPAGGKSGAREAIRDGALVNPEVKAIFGMHAWPALPEGTVGLQRGVTMAAADSFLVEVHGESAHAGEPNEGRDAIFAASSLILQLKSLVGRELPPGEPATINVGVVRGGKTQSIVADLVELSGTLRTLGGNSRERMVRRMLDVANGVSRESGCTVDLRISDSFPAVVNAPALYERTASALITTLGEAHVVEIREIPLTADDFAYYLESVPGLYLKIGCAPRDRTCYPLHHPCFDLGEEALWTGVKALAAAIVAEMEAHSASSGGLP